MNQVTNLKTLLDAAKPFMAALPDGHPIGKIVKEYVAAETVASGNLVHNDSLYFDAAASISIVHGDQLVDYYIGLAETCELMPAPTVDPWDGCENGGQ